MKPSYLPVSLSHNNNKKNFLGEGHQDFGTPIWLDMWVRGPRLKNPSDIPAME